MLHRIAKTLACLLLLSTVSCAPHYRSPDLTGGLPPPSAHITRFAHQGLERLAQGDYAGAHRQLTHALALAPDNCHLNFLNALAYQLSGRGGDESALRLAEVGYTLAIRQCPADPWPHFYYGLLQLQRKNFDTAELSFKEAYEHADHPYIANFLAAYLVAAYDSGDYEIAQKLLKQLSIVDRQKKTDHSYPKQNGARYSSN